MKIGSYQIPTVISELSYVSSPSYIIFCHVSLILHFINISHGLHTISTNFLKQFTNLSTKSKRFPNILQRSTKISHLYREIDESNAVEILEQTKKSSIQMEEKITSNKNIAQICILVKI
jgi:hypothetical protein